MQVFGTEITRPGAQAEQAGGGGGGFGGGLGGGCGFVQVQMSRVHVKGGLAYVSWHVCGSPSVAGWQATYCVMPLLALPCTHLLLVVVAVQGALLQPQVVQTLLGPDVLWPQALAAQLSYAPRATSAKAVATTATLSLLIV